MHLCRYRAAQLSHHDAAASATQTASDSDSLDKTSASHGGADVTASSSAASLIEAVERKDHDAVARMIASGWDVNERNQYGETPLHAAVTGDDTEAVTMLLMVRIRLA